MHMLLKHQKELRPTIYIISFVCSPFHPVHQTLEPQYLSPRADLT